MIAPVHLLDHVGHRSASESQHSMHVTIEHLTPTLFVHLEESTWDSRACGVDKNVDSPSTVTSFNNRAGTGINTANVCLDVNGFSAVPLPPLGVFQVNRSVVFAYDRS